MCNFARKIVDQEISGMWSLVDDDEVDDAAERDYWLQWSGREWPDHCGKENCWQAKGVRACHVKSDRLPGTWIVPLCRDCSDLRVKDGNNRFSLRDGAIIVSADRSRSGLRLERLNLQDYRGFAQQSFDLAGKSAVFFGINGAGKSSILHALNVLYAPVISKLTGKRLPKTLSLQRDDVAAGAKECSLDLRLQLCGRSFDFQRSIRRKLGTMQPKRTALTEFINYFQAQYEYGSDLIGMPVFVHYGVHRMVLDIPLRIRSHHEFTRYSAYENTVDSKIDFRTFFEWFRYQEDLENEQKIKRQDFDYQDRSLRAVRQAIYGMLDGMTHLRIERRPLAMKIDKDGVSLSISQLSDGEKGLVTLFGDLSRRLALANPMMDNPCLGEGIVMIDEIDLHLHPSWQRRIIPALRRTFPHIQFIITTHSPQVLGELGADFQIYQLQQDEHGIVGQQLPRLDGWSSNEILEVLMATARQNADVQVMFRTVFDAIERDDFTVAKQKLAELRERVFPDDADYIRAETMLRLRMRRHDLHS